MFYWYTHTYRSNLCHLCYSWKISSHQTIKYTHYPFVQTFHNSNPASLFNLLFTSHARDKSSLSFNLETMLQGWIVVNPIYISKHNLISKLCLFEYWKGCLHIFHHWFHKNTIMKKVPLIVTGLIIKCPLLWNIYFENCPDCSWSLEKMMLMPDIHNQTICIWASFLCHSPFLLLINPLNTPVCCLHFCQQWWGMLTGWLHRKTEHYTAPHDNMTQHNI